MQFEILETPLRFQLYGRSAAVPNHAYGEVGKKLMDEMWKILKESRTANKGVNHWVYLADGRMFVGAELLPNTPAPESLEPLEFELQRYLSHLHLGPYQDLPAKWQALKAELAARGEALAWPSLEIYGHHSADPAKQETTILIGLQGMRSQ